MKRSQMRAFVTLIAVICLGAAFAITVRSTKIGQSLNDDPQALSRLPVRQMKYWEANFKKKLEDRIALPPEEVLNYLRADNLRQGYEEVPTAAPNYASLDSFHRALKALPQKMRKRLEKKLAAIYLVENLGGSAISNVIFLDGPETPEVASFVAFDVKALLKPANAWASWKDQSPFSDGVVKLTTHIAEQDDDTLDSTVQFILLHELGHVLAVGENIHPSWDLLTANANLSEYPFTSLSWKIERGSYHRENNFEGYELPDVYFYAPEKRKLANSEILKVYTGLEHSPFVTLYASTNPFDDFADTFATYVHTQVLHRSYEVRIFNGENLVKTYKPCFGENRCKAKEELIKDFYKRL